MRFQTFSSLAVCERKGDLWVDGCSNKVGTIFTQKVLGLTVDGFCRFEKEHLGGGGSLVLLVPVSCSVFFWS